MRQNAFYMAKHRIVMRHRKPTRAKQSELLDRQSGRCFYCLCKLNEWMTIQGKPVFTGLHWDHIIPWAFCQKNEDGNFVASCRLCNVIKSDKVFEQIYEARYYVQRERLQRGLPVFELPCYVHPKKVMAKVLQAEMQNGTLLEASCNRKFTPRSRISIINGQYVGIPEIPPPSTRLPTVKTAHIES